MIIALSYILAWQKTESYIYVNNARKFQVSLYLNKSGRVFITLIAKIIHVL